MQVSSILCNKKAIERTELDHYRFFLEKGNSEVVNGCGDLVPFTEDLWDSVDTKMRQLFLKQRHGEKSEDFEVFVRYDSANLPKGAKLQDILPPFVFEPEKRALLRVALDARYARLYGLTRDDLRYILDPADLMGEDYPSETFRVLKEKEIAEFGEYRMRRLVLEAWDGDEVMTGSTT